MKIDNNDIITLKGTLKNLPNNYDLILWDFNNFVLVGNKEHPKSQLKSFDYYNILSQDAEEVGEKEVTFYKGDFVVYYETDFANSSHIIENNEIYEIINREIDSNKNKILVSPEIRNSPYLETKEYVEDEDIPIRELR